MSASRPTAPPVPGLPRDAEGPVFREPWEAQAFALVVRLHEEGHFAWSEWAALLADEIARAQRAGDPDLGGTYYHHWLRALERLAVQKSWAAPDDLAARAAALATPAPGGHDHGDDHNHPH